MLLKQISHKYWRAASSQKAEWYDVFVDRGKYSCTCADFVFRGQHRPCKHILEVLDRL